MTAFIVLAAVLAQAPPAVDQTTNAGYVTATYRNIKDESSSVRR